MTNSKKRNIAIVWLLTLVMLVSGFFAVSTFSQTAEAFTGTEIATAEEFVDFITNVASVNKGDGKTYALTANVDLSAYSEDSVFISNLAGAVNLNGKFHYGTYYLENVPGNPSSIFGEDKSSVTENGATVAGKENIRIVIKDVTVTTAEGVTSFSSFDVANFPAGSTVKLLKDVSLSSAIVADKSFTIDLNGFNLDVAMSFEGTGNARALEISGENTVVTLTDTTAVKNGMLRGTWAGNSDSRLVNVLSGGKFVLNAGTITAVTTGTRSAQGVYLSSNASFEMNGGALNIKNAGSTSGAGVNVRSSGASFVMNGGVILSEGFGVTTGNINGEGTTAAVIDIKGGSLSGTRSAVSGAQGKLDFNITGGTINGSISAAGQNTMDITGGTINGNISSGASALTIDGDAVINGTLDTSKSNKATLNSVSASSSMVIAEGSKFVNDISDVIGSGVEFSDPSLVKFAVKLTDGTVVYQYAADDSAYAAKIGDFYFTTLQIALGNVAAGETLDLLADIDDGLVIDADKNFKLNLNGYKITATTANTYALYNLGTLEVIDTVGTGKIYFDNAVYHYTVYNEGNLTLTDITVENTAPAGSGNHASLLNNNQDASSENPAVLTVNGGNYTSNVSTILKNNEYGIVYINGGNLTSLETYLGGYNSVINWGTMTITDGNFTSEGTVLGTGLWNEGNSSLTVTGGTFTAKEGKAALAVTKHVEEGYDDETLNVSIQNGKFDGVIGITIDSTALTGEDSFAITGGEYTKPVSSKYVGDDFVLASGESGSFSVYASDEVPASAKLVAGRAATPFAAESLETGYSQIFDGTEYVIVSSASASVVNAEATIGGVYYSTLAAAVANASESDTIVLIKDIETDTITVNKSVKIDGDGFTIKAVSGGKVTIAFSLKEGCGTLSISNVTIKASRGVDLNSEVTNVPNTVLNGVTMIVTERGVSYGTPEASPVTGVTGEIISVTDSKFYATDDVDTAIDEAFYETFTYTSTDKRGISLYNISGEYSIKVNASALKGFKYTVNIASNCAGMTANIIDSTVYGWAAIQTWSNDVTMNIIGSTLKGIQVISGVSNDFSTIVFNSGVTGGVLNLTDSTVTNYKKDGVDTTQSLINFRDAESVSEINISGEVKLENTTNDKMPAFESGDNVSDTDIFALVNKVISVEEGATLTVTDDYVLNTDNVDFTKVEITESPLFTLADYVKIFKDRLNAEYAEYNEADYKGTYNKLTLAFDEDGDMIVTTETIDNYAAITEFYNGYVKAIDRAKTQYEAGTMTFDEAIATMQKAYADGVANFATVQTLLSVVKTNYKAGIEAYVKNLDPSLYTEENWAKIKTIESEGLKSLADCDNIDGANGVYEVYDKVIADITDTLTIVGTARKEFMDARASVVDVFNQYVVENGFVEDNYEAIAWSAAQSKINIIVAKINAYPTNSLGYTKEDWDNAKAFILELVKEGKFVDTHTFVAAEIADLKDVPDKTAKANAIQAMEDYVKQVGESYEGVSEGFSADIDFVSDVKVLLNASVDFTSAFNKAVAAINASATNTSINNAVDVFKTDADVLYAEYLIDLVKDYAMAYGYAADAEDVATACAIIDKTAGYADNNVNYDDALVSVDNSFAAYKAALVKDINDNHSYGFSAVVNADSVIKALMDSYRATYAEYLNKITTSETLQTADAFYAQYVGTADDGDIKTLFGNFVKDVSDAGTASEYLFSAKVTNDVLNVGTYSEEAKAEINAVIAAFDVSGYTDVKTAAADIETYYNSEYSKAYLVYNTLQTRFLSMIETYKALMPEWLFADADAYTAAVALMESYKVTVTDKYKVLADLEEATVKFEAEVLSQAEFADTLTAASVVFAGVNGNDPVNANTLSDTLVEGDTISVYYIAKENGIYRISMLNTLTYTFMSGYANVDGSYASAEITGTNIDTVDCINITAETGEYTVILGKNYTVTSLKEAYNLLGFSVENGSEFVDAIIFSFKRADSTAVDTALTELAAMYADYAEGDYTYESTAAGKTTYEIITEIYENVKESVKFGRYVDTAALEGYDAKTLEEKLAYAETAFASVPDDALIAKAGTFMEKVDAMTEALAGGDVTAENIAALETLQAEIEASYRITADDKAVLSTVYVSADIYDNVAELTAAYDNYATYITAIAAYNKSVADAFLAKVNALDPTDTVNYSDAVYDLVNEFKGFSASITALLKAADVEEFEYDGNAYTGLKTDAALDLHYLFAIEVELLNFKVEDASRFTDYESDFETSKAKLNALTEEQKAVIQKGVDHADEVQAAINAIYTHETTVTGNADAYVAGLDQENYTTSGWTYITETLLVNAKYDFTNCTTIKELNDRYAAFKKAVDLVPSSLSEARDAAILDVTQYVETIKMNDSNTGLRYADRVWKLIIADRDKAVADISKASMTEIDGIVAAVKEKIASYLTLEQEMAIAIAEALADGTYTEELKYSDLGIYSIIKYWIENEIILPEEDGTVDVDNVKVNDAVFHTEEVRTLVAFYVKEAVHTIQTAATYEHKEDELVKCLPDILNYYRDKVNQVVVDSIIPLIEALPEIDTEYTYASLTLSETVLAQIAEIRLTWNDLTADQQKLVNATLTAKFENAIDKADAIAALRNGTYFDKDTDGRYVLNDYNDIAILIIALKVEADSVYADYTAYAAAEYSLVNGLTVESNFDLSTGISLANAVKIYIGGDKGIVVNDGATLNIVGFAVIADMNEGLSAVTLNGTSALNLGAKASVSNSAEGASQYLVNITNTDAKVVFNADDAQLVNNQAATVMFNLGEGTEVLTNVTPYSTNTLDNHLKGAVFTVTYVDADENLIYTDYVSFGGTAKIVLPGKDCYYYSEFQYTDGTKAADGDPDKGKGTETSLDTISNVQANTVLKAVYTPIEYTITYELRKGATTETLVTTYNVETETFLLPLATTMTRKYFNFDAWYLNEVAEGNKITQITKGSSGDITIIANWVVDESEVDFIIPDWNTLKEYAELTQDEYTDFFRKANYVINVPAAGISIEEAGLVFETTGKIEIKAADAASRIKVINGITFKNATIISDMAITFLVSSGDFVLDGVTMSVNNTAAPSAVTISGTAVADTTVTLNGSVITTNGYYGLAVNGENGIVEVIDSTINVNTVSTEYASMGIFFNKGQSLSIDADSVINMSRTGSSNAMTQGVHVGDGSTATVNVAGTLNFTGTNYTSAVGIAAYGAKGEITISADIKGFIYGTFIQNGAVNTTEGLVINFTGDGITENGYGAVLALNATGVTLNADSYTFKANAVSADEYFGVISMMESTGTINLVNATVENVYGDGATSALYLFNIKDSTGTIDIKGSTLKNTSKWLMAVVNGGFADIYDVATIDDTTVLEGYVHIVSFYDEAGEYLGYVNAAHGGDITSLTPEVPAKDYYNHDANRWALKEDGTEIDLSDVNDSIAVKPIYDANFYTVANGTEEGFKGEFTFETEGQYTTEVTVKFEMNEGYQMDAVKVYTGYGTEAQAEIAVTLDKESGTFTFLMPHEAVTFVATYKFADDVQAVIDAIDAIGAVKYNSTSEGLIDAARNLYDGLTETAQGLVTNYETLTVAEAWYKYLGDTITEFNDFVTDTYLEVDYEAAQWTELQDIVAQAIADISDISADETVVEGIVTKAKEDLDAVVSKLDTSKENAKNEVEAYRDTLLETYNYSAEAVALMNEYVAAANDAIMASVNSNELAKAIATAKRELDSVETVNAEFTAAKKQALNDLALYITTLETANAVEIDVDVVAEAEGYIRDAADLTELTAALEKAKALVKAYVYDRTFDVTFVTYDLEGNKVDEAVLTMAYGTSLADIAKMMTADDSNFEDAGVKYNYAFTGWSYEGTVLTKDVVMTAVFDVTPVEYTLTYKVDGEEYAVYTLGYGTATVVEGTPVKTGYTFGGWSDIPTRMPAENVVVEGSFTANTYRVNYFVDGTLYKSEDVIFGEAVTAIAAPVKTGYTFGGWSETPETMPAGDVNVYGTFTINTFTVTFKVDGETVKEQTVAYGSDAVAPTVSKVGYDFTGWDKAFANITADITVNAEFAIKTFTVDFLNYDGTLLQSVTVNYDGTAAYTAAAPTRTGDAQYTYTFDKWNKTLTNIKADTTVTAVFKAAVNKYTVTFKGFNNATLKTEEVAYGAAATAPSLSDVTGYTFTGWDKAFNAVFTDITVTAQYAIKTYTVTFVMDGNVVSVQTVAHGGNATAPTVSKEGYDFTGWNGSYENVTADVTVTAEFTLQNKIAEAKSEVTAWLNNYLDKLLGVATGDSSAMLAVNVNVSLAAKADTTALTLTSEESELMTKLLKVYSQDNADRVIMYYREALAYLDNATTESEINYAMISFQNNVSNVLTLEQEKTPVLDIILYVWQFVVLVLLVVLFIMILKKKNNTVTVTEDSDNQGGSESTNFFMSNGVSATEDGAEVSESEDNAEADEEIAAEEDSESAEDDGSEAEEDDSEETEDDDEDDEEESLNNIASGEEGLPFFIAGAERKPSKSFEERLIGAPEEVKAVYSEIKNEILSYKKVKCRPSRRNESFRAGRVLLSKLAVAGKTIKLYLALDPEKYDVKIYHHKNVGTKKAFASVPMFVKVRSNLSIKKAKKLIGEVMQDKNVVKNAKYENVDFAAQLKAPEDVNE